MTLHDRPLVSIDNLRVEFQGEDGPIVGVEDVSFSIASGETVCVVGESGSGSWMWPRPTTPPCAVSGAMKSA